MAKPLSFPVAVRLGLLLLWWLGPTLMNDASNAHAQTRRALLVGINTYALPDEAVAESTRAGRTWTNLDGALNDVTALRAVLVSRFGFQAEHIHTLTEAEATREGIVAALQRFSRESQAGDALVFFFAGHGSQIRNLGSLERDRLDETIVPADANSGTRDVRDKELRDLFNALLDKDIELTLIFDSCHSGSITRGLSPGKSRYLSPDPTQTVNDPSDPPKPEDRGALVLSAAQDREWAREIVDEDGFHRGAFSWALVEALRTAPPDESARRLFQRVRARMRGIEISQEPVLGGRADRLDQPIFGGERRSAGTTVALVDVRSDNTVVLQGGLAVGLRPGSELLQTEAAPASAVRLRVRAVEGLTRATAEIVDGDPSTLESGDLFKVVSWVASAGGPLRVWVPPALPRDAVGASAAALHPLQRDPSFDWVTDPTETPPSHVIAWTGTRWTIRLPTGEARDIGTPLDADTVRDVLLTSGTSNTPVYLDLPPPAELAEALLAHYQSSHDAVELAAGPEQSHYLLTGHARSDGEVEYAWVRRGATQQRGDTSLPPRTDWILASASSAADKLTGFTSTLERTWGWMHLESPPQEDESFPYDLVGFENTHTGTRRALGDTLRAGETYWAVLGAESEALEEAQRLVRINKAVGRYVYLFVIDQAGSSGLIYPRRGSVENHFGQRSAPAEIKLGHPTRGLFRVGEPYGVDTFFLLTTEKAIPDLSVFTFSGVRVQERGDDPRCEDEQALSRLLCNMKQGTRDGGSSLPTSWSLQRMSVRSAAE